jgi:peroxiredoxin Q/BCP
MQAFRDGAAEFAEANAQVLGVSVDSFAAAEAFRKDLGCDFPLLGDWPLYRTGQVYGVYDPERFIHRRVTFVLDKDHIIRAIIDDSRDMERHARESLEELKKLTP